MYGRVSTKGKVWNFASSQEILFFSSHKVCSKNSLLANSRKLHLIFMKELISMALLLPAGFITKGFVLYVE